MTEIVDAMTEVRACFHFMPILSLHTHTHTRTQEVSDETVLLNHAMLNRGKNMMIKIVMLTTAVVVLLLSATTLPVFPSTGFSNAYYTVLVASAILALPLISPARHLTLVSFDAHDELLHLLRTNICHAAFLRFCLTA